MYTKPTPSDGDVMTKSVFRANVRDGFFIDGDGFGYPVKELADGFFMDDNDRIYPSDFFLPKDATHIVWFNK